MLEGVLSHNSEVKQKNFDFGLPYFNYFRAALFKIIKKISCQTFLLLRKEKKNKGGEQERQFLGNYVDCNRVIKKRLLRDKYKADEKRNFLNMMCN